MHQPIRYEKNTILEGNVAQKKAEETAPSFAMYNGEPDALTPDSLVADNQKRMAGPKGLFAMELMSNPEAQYETNKWLNEFGQTVPGDQFNMVKKQQAMNEAQLAQTNAMLGRG